MKKPLLAIFVVAILFATPRVLRADGGCLDSAENPTAVFGLVAAAASVGFARFRGRSISRRSRPTAKSADDKN